MRPKIKFSHDYTKFPGWMEGKSKLIQLFIVNKANLSDEFKMYDTRYEMCGLKHEYYQLPEGELIVLLLLTEANELWTTIRRYTPRKYGYYQSHIGDEFDIIVKEEE